jgi:hypothetical protein
VSKTSFLGGAIGDISSFFSGASNTFGGIVNFGSNIVSGIQNAVQGIINGVQQLGSAIIQGVESIGSDIVNTFSTLGVAIWHGLVTFGLTVGNFFYGAFHDLSGAVYGAFTRIASAFEFIGKFISSGISAIGTGIHNLGNWIYNGIIDGLTSLSLFGLSLYQDIRNIFTTIYNGLVIAGEDIANFFSSIASNVESLFNSLLSFITQYASDIEKLPIDATKYMTSRLSNVLPRLTGWNMFFESKKAFDRIATFSAYRSPLKGTLIGIGSPFLAGVSAYLTELATKLFFPEIVQSQTPTPHPTTSATLQPSTASNVNVPNVFTQAPSSTVSPTTIQKSSVESPSLSQYSHYIVGVNEEDSITLQGNVAISSKLQSAYPNSQEIADSVVFMGTMYQSIAQVITLQYEDSISPSIDFSFNIEKESPISTLNAVFNGGVTLNNYIIGFPLCIFNNFNSIPLITGNTINDDILGVASLCYPPYTTGTDTIGITQGLIQPDATAEYRDLMTMQQGSLTPYAVYEAVGVGATVTFTASQ